MCKNPKLRFKIWFLGSRRGKKLFSPKVTSQSRASFPSYHQPKNGSQIYMRDRSGRAMISMTRCPMTFGLGMTNPQNESTPPRAGLLADDPPVSSDDGRGVRDHPRARHGA